MKKIILVALLMGSIQSLFAQSIKLGIKGGLNAANTDRGEIPAGNSSSYRVGFNAGVFADFEYDKWSIEPGLFYTVKGANYKSVLLSNTPSGGGTEDLSIKGKHTFNYLELPVNVLYNIKIKPGKIFVGAGPYLGYFLSGKLKDITKTSATTSDYEQNLDIGSGGVYKRTDFGLNALAGVTFNSGLLFSIGYGYGLTNIINDAASGKIKNRVMNISVGYSFL